MKKNSESSSTVIFFSNFFNICFNWRQVDVCMCFCILLQDIVLVETCEQMQPLTENKESPASVNLPSTHLTPAKILLQIISKVPLLRPPHGSPPCVLTPGAFLVVLGWKESKIVFYSLLWVGIYKVYSWRCVKWLINPFLRDWYKGGVTTGLILGSVLFW